MEFDIIPFLQLGTTGALFAWFIFEYFKNQKNKKGDNSFVDGGQNVIIARIDERLKTIETNELVHIKKQLETNAKEHQDILVALAEIKIRLEEVL